MAGRNRSIKTTAKLSQQFARVFEAAGCRNLLFHDLPHEATCRLFERTNLSDLQIAKITGHKDPRMLACYAQLARQRLGRYAVVITTIFQVIKLGYIYIFAVAVLLGACATTRPGVVGYLDRADSEIAQGNWEVAYRFAEDGLVSSNPELKARAINSIRQHPQVLSAGARTFAKDRVASTVSAHGESRGVDLERRRLEMYKVVATPSDYAIAKSNIDSLVADMDAQRVASVKLNEEKRQKDEQARLEKELKKKETKLAVTEAARDARFTCHGKSECERAFSLTQVFLSENSDMKIQVATDTILETYNPTDSMKVGLKAVKMPRKGDTAEIMLTATCRGDGREVFDGWCDIKLASIYRAYPKFIQSAMRH